VTCLPTRLCCSFALHQPAQSFIPCSAWSSHPSTRSMSSNHSNVSPGWIANRNFPPLGSSIVPWSSHSNTVPRWSASAQHYSDRNLGCYYVIPEALDLVRGTDFILLASADGYSISCRAIALVNVRKDFLAKLASSLGMERVHAQTPHLLSLLCTHIWSRFFQAPVSTGSTPPTMLPAPLNTGNTNVAGMKKAPTPVAAAVSDRSGDAAVELGDTNTQHATSSVACPSNQTNATSNNGASTPNAARKDAASVLVSVEPCAKNDEVEKSALAVTCEKSAMAAATGAVASSDRSEKQGPKLGDTIVLKRGQGEKRKYNGNEATVAVASSDRSEDQGLKLGDTIVLKRGQGEKRKYNGSEATVTAYPVNGDTMTVFVSSKRVKWSKRDYAAPLPELKEEAMVAIFRFLGSPDEKEPSSSDNEEELVWVRDAVKVHTQLASVCRSWREICNQYLSVVLGRLNANFDALDTGTIIPVAQWLVKHNLVIGSLKFDAELEDLPLLVQLLTECDTTKLANVRAYVDKSYRRWSYKASEWISAAYHARACQGHFVNLTNGSQDISFECKAKYLGVPVCTMTQKDFHDILAAQCPNLATLSLTVSMPVRQDQVRCSEYLSSALFSLSSITNLEVGLCCHLSARGSWPINGTVFYKMIKNLTSLTKLSIKTSKSNSCVHGRRFLIMSPTLKILDTTGLGKHVWVSCLECPKLERFKCNGAAYGNGTRPLFTGDDLVNMDSFEESFVKDGDLKVNAGRVDFAGLDVPDTCECILRDFCSFKTDWILEANRNAMFETW